VNSIKDYYDFSKMEEAPHPLQAKIDSGELKLIDPFDISDEEFNIKIALMAPEDREFILQL